MVENYQAVILAGGKGTRLYPITKEVPKPLLPIHKKPIINYLVDLFFSQGVNEIAILISKEFREDFEWWKKRYYGSNGAPRIEFMEEDQPLGTLGGLWHLKDRLADTSFFVTNGDELKEIDLAKMKSFHQEKNPLATIALVKVSNPQDYGVVVCENGMVSQFLEKPKDPPSNYINSGLYLFNPGVFAYHPGPVFSMIEKDLFPKLASDKKLAGFMFEGKWTDCGTWERYEKALENWQ